jgi:glutamate-1-semialdehyde 2,1-aminomutase
MGIMSVTSDETVRHVEDQLAHAVATHRSRNPRSELALQQLAQWLPGGDTRGTTWFEPFPLVIESALGANMVDLDQHQLVDFLGNYTSLVHGHRPALVTHAIKAALERGTVFAAPLLEQGELASRLVGRLASVDLVRFANSGTEANLLAANIARAVTGRQRVAVARFSYHGGYEGLDWHNAPSSTGPVVFPANDVEGTIDALGDGHDLAAIFIELVQHAGGVMPTSPEYLSFLRDFTQECGALLVFDEVVTLRLAHGGRQEELGVSPDLTSMGKIIGGGLPIGAVGGSASVMESTSPQRGALLHNGTFNGNRLAMVAGAAALDLLDRNAIERINGLGVRLANGIRVAATGRGLGVSVTSCGSLLTLHALPDVQSAAQGQVAASQPLRRLLHLKLLEHGLFIAPRGEFVISTAMDDDTIDAALTSVQRTFDDISELKPSYD